MVSLTDLLSKHWLSPIASNKVADLMLQHFVMTEMMVVMVVVMMIIRGQGHDPKTRAGTCRVDLEI